MHIFLNYVLDVEKKNIRSIYTVLYTVSCHDISIIKTEKKNIFDW